MISFIVASVIAGGFWLFWRMTAHERERAELNERARLNAENRTAQLLDEYIDSVNRKP